MDFAHYKDAFIKEAHKTGYSLTNIQRCLDYADALFLHEVPVIYNPAHLSGLVGYKKEYLKKASLFPNYFYRDFEVAKKNGSKRLISEPLPSLKEIQIWILRNILYKIPSSAFAKAYRPTVTLLENLRFHKKQFKVFTLDLENFFPSIRVEAVENEFLKLGYSKIVSKLLSKLCTRNGTLPQGAPTSPYLSNLVFKEADAAIAAYCKEHKIRYTRYADDMNFSGDFDENELLQKVTETVEKMGLQINAKKTKLMTTGMRQTVTGVVVNEKPQVVFYKRNELRQALYYIQKFGFEEHREYKEIDQKNYLEHLLGKINFVLQINPKDAEFIKYKSVLIDLKNKQDLKALEDELLPI